MSAAMLRCWIYRKLLTAHLEESLPGVLCQTVSRHMASCADCEEQWQQLRSVSLLLRQLPAPAVPPDLELQIRLRLSRERRRSQQPSWSWRWGNLLSPFALPGAAGVLLAVVIFGAFFPLLNQPVRADSSDVPLTLRTPPRLRSSGPISLNSSMEGLVVQLLVDQNGRVADYQILTGNYTSDDVRVLRNLLLFTVFYPATLFGHPMPDTIVFPLRDVSDQTFLSKNAG
ncbi:MAG: hypothetical protein HY647_11395 [Acidobacteria bacterium]|nr:hypothetical protein [Acidobacteriota bacterium]